jgi:transcriptional regulator with XRE-family HTH domain
VEPSAESRRALARRLRELRQEGWPGVTVRQPQLARALGVSVPSVSSWESERNPQPPPVARIADYARFFATPRTLDSVGHARLIGDDELTASERHRFEELEDELIALRDAIDAPQRLTAHGRGPLYFADGAPITIVCAPLPDNLKARMPYTDPDEPDYIESYAYADLDGLIQLHGHVKAMNPESDVRIRRAAPTSFRPDDLTTHLLLLGGVDWNILTRDILNVLPVPVAQTTRDDEDSVGWFEVGEGDDQQTFRPELVRRGARKTLVSDVAHLFRGPNPLNRKRTVTIFNGMYGRGVLGAVRSLTDVRFRDRNAEYLAERFPGDTYSVVTRVQIVMRDVVTPDLTVAETRLHEWPDA